MTDRIKADLHAANSCQYVDDFWSLFFQVVTEYESGKAIPNQQILAKMERALGLIFLMKWS